MVAWLPFLVALCVALLLTPAARRLASLTGIVDHPDSRKVHATPTPLLGGVAIHLAICAAWLAAMPVVPGCWQDPIPLVIGVTTALMLVGLFDDWICLWWLLKLAIQITAATLLCLFGVCVELSWLPPWANVSLTLLWLVGITNAINFLDNMNGLAGGLCAIAAGTMSILALMNGSPALAGMSAAVAGACLGFLRFNYREASIFMGDAGSLLLGLLIAALGLLLRFPGIENWVTWMTPVMVMLVPVFDMTLVCLSRLAAGRNPLATPGKDHVSHRLVALGFSKTRAVDSIYGAAVLCGACGFGVTVLPQQAAYGVGLLLLVLFMAGQLFFLRRVPVAYPDRRGQAQ